MSDTDSKGGSVVLSKVLITTTDTTDVVPLEQDSCPPLPEDVAKRSKKRLREASVEASTPKDDETIVPVDAREVEVPPKKNRLQSVGHTDCEEAHTSPPTTPPATDGSPLSTSPPHESKVRQIRKRVKDLSWIEGHRRKSDEGSAGEVDPQDDGPEAGDATSEGKDEEDDSSKSVSAKSDSEKEEERAGTGKDDSSKSVSAKSDSEKEEERAGTGKVATTEVTPGPLAGASTPPGSPPRSPPDVPSTTLPEPAAAVEEKDPENDSIRATVTRLSPDPESCQGKRRRDDGDQNPRETKRISPPPDKEKDEAKPKPVKLTGFMAYASTASPFAAVKDATNVFGSTNPPSTFGTASVPKPTAPSSNPPASTPFTRTTPLAPQASAPVTFGTSGFSAYASAASPFAGAKASGPSPFGVASTSPSKPPSRVERSKSPGRHANAFGPYTSRSGKFAVTSSRPSKKPRRGSSSNGVDGVDAGTGSGSGSGDEPGDEEPPSPTSFGDILSAKENKADFAEAEKKIEFKEQEVTTGEEDETTEYQVRAKLFAMTPGSDSGWKERGVGTLKLNVNNTTGRARLVLRTDGVLRLILNTSLFRGMNFEIAQDPRYVKFGIIVDEKVVLHTLRLGSVRHTEDLLEQVKDHTGN